MKRIKLFVLFQFLFFISTLSFAQDLLPEALVPGVKIERVMTVRSNSVRILFDSLTKTLVYVRDNGQIYKVIQSGSGSASDSLMYSSSSHGLTKVTGIASYDSSLYLVGFDRPSGTTNRGIIKKGKLLKDGKRAWSTVAVTDPIPATVNTFEHQMNGIIMSQNGKYLLVNSGSRTDHGEVEDLFGAFPNLRETPITSCILKIPSDANNITIPDDSLALANGGFIFADGVRNTYDMAMDGNGRLFGCENSGDRDDADELNWLQEGKHYGFPWAAGGTTNPTINKSYSPGNDPLLNSSYFAVFSNLFYADSTFPQPPIGINFTSPVINYGPDADQYRDSSGIIRDASAQGKSVSTFTAHRSPLGLVFDEDSLLGNPYTGDGFLLGFSRNNFSTGPLNDSSEDLMHLKLLYDENTKNFTSQIKVAAVGFINPIDAVMVGTDMYVLEYGSSGSIWKIRLPAKEPNAVEEAVNFKSIKVYPNPCKEQVIFSCHLNPSAEVFIKLYNPQGTEIASERNFCKEGSKEIIFDTTLLLPGVYIYKIDINGEVRTGKLVKIP